MCVCVCVCVRACVRACVCDEWCVCTRGGKMSMIPFIAHLTLCVTSKGFKCSMKFY